MAASLVIAVVRNDQNQQIASDVVSAHLRSLQAGHLTDVETSDQHTVKPWFNGKLDVAPPVIDLTAQGFTLIGGRLDYINGQPVASIVYRRRKHVINLFVAQQLGAAVHGVKDKIVQGFNIRHWSESASTCGRSAISMPASSMNSAKNSPRRCTRRGRPERPSRPRINNKTGLYRGFSMPRHLLPRS